MKMRFEKDLPVLLFALLSVSTLASLPQAESAWAGAKAVYSEQDFGLRILREAMLVALANPHGAQEPAGLDGRISGGGDWFEKRQDRDYLPVLESAEELEDKVQV